jgi:hypothetical protein
MNLPPPLRSSPAAQTLTATGTVDPESLFPSTRTELTFSLPLPAGFTVSGTSAWMVTLPTGFTLPGSASGESVNFFGLAPYEYNAVLNPPSTIGPLSEPTDGFPAGTLWVWSALNNQQTYTGITLQFILQNVVNPSATGLTGNIAVQIGGTSSQCVFTVPGITIANG